MRIQSSVRKLLQQAFCLILLAHSREMFIIKLTGATFFVFQENLERSHGRRHCIKECSTAVAQATGALLNATCLWSRLRSRSSFVILEATAEAKFNMYVVYCRYPDTYVRNKAVDQLKQLPPDDLYDLLPQLVQVCLYITLDFFKVP